MQKITECTTGYLSFVFPFQIKLPISSLSSSDALLRTDSLSGTDPALSDGSVGSAPSLGLSPGPPCSAESTRSQDKNKAKNQMISEGMDEDGLEERVKAEGLLSCRASVSV